MNMQSYKTIDEYIKNYPKEVQVMMKELRKVIKEVAPEATEKIAYGIPTFVLHGNLVHFGAFEKHIGFFPGSSGVAAFQEKLGKYKTSKGTIQLPLDKPIPVTLVKQIVKFRVKQNLEKTKKK